MTIRLIGLDADDTLWHNEPLFRMTADRFGALLADHAPRDAVTAALEAVERRNIGLYGYGAKGFTLSMLEAAIELSDGCVPAAVLGEIMAGGRDLMRHPIDPLPGVEAALETLAGIADLVLITKGDLFHQEQKLAGSGLGRHFAGVEIVSEKTADGYVRAFRRHGAAPDAALMAGNSVRSDVLPALAAGAWAALVPYPLVWAHEAADPPAGHPRFREVASLADLPAWIAEIRSAG